ncbi:MAG: tetratricopeptide repeat protein [Candidatus Sulfotelmatobacter sp.]
MANLEASHSKAGWTDVQAYVLAVFCLVLGVALGYLFRGSASPVTQTAQASAAADGGVAQGQPPQGQITPEQQKAMVDQAVAPLLTTLKNSPDDFDTIVRVANLYYDGRQYPEAVKYYQLAVKSQPDNADVLTDLGTSLWYTGDVDGAIAEFQTALKYRPDHPGTLFNLGVVRWQGKLDPKGAVQAWEELLRRNPDYPQKQEVEEYIERAKQHDKG